MSIITKSNNTLSSLVNGFGTVNMLGTTAQAQFDAYKARVLADGGVIKDEARTLKAFNLLFNSKMYGNMNTAVSGTFGVKLDSNGGITKLYAIDGTDLIGTAYGTGTLPKLDANNNIDFSTNSATDNVNGAMFSTANKMVVSRTGRFGAMLFMKSIDTSAPQRLSALTKHNDVVFASTGAIMTIATSIYGEVILSMQTDPFKLSGATYVTARLIATAPTSFVTIPENSAIYGSRYGAEATAPTGKTFTQITTEEFYIDFGGQYYSDKKFFGSGVERDFFCFSHASREQASMLSAFTA